MRRGEEREALPLARRALEILEAERGPDHVDTSGATHILARIYLGLKRFDAAVPLLQRTARILTRAFGPDDARVGSAHGNLARAFGGLGRYDDAVREFGVCVTIYERALGPSSPHLAGALQGQASLLNTMGRNAEALPIVERAIEIAEATSGEATSRYALPPLVVTRAQIRGRLGLYAAARADYERARTLYEEVYGKRHPQLAVLLSQYALFVRERGDPEAALRLLEISRGIRAERYGEDSVQVATDLVNISMCRRNLENGPDEVMALLERAFAIQQAAFGDDHPDVANTRLNMADLLLDAGEPAKARGHAMAAARAFERQLAPDAPRLVEGLSAAAACHRRLGELDEAAALYRRILALREAAVGPDHPALVPTLQNLAWIVRHREDDIPGAVQLMRRSLDITFEDTKRQLAATSPAERLLYMRLTQARLDNWLAFCVNSKTNAYEQALRFKGLVGRSTALEKHALRSADPKTRVVLDSLRDATTELATISQSPATDSRRRALWRASLARAAARVDELTLELARVSSELAEVQSRLDLGFEDVRDALGPGEALVDFARVRDEIYLAWVVLPGAREAKQIVLGRTADVDAAAEGFRAAVLEATEPDEQRLRDAGARVREVLWSRLEEAVGDAHTVYLVPDGALGAVPFAAIPRSDGRALVESHLLAWLETAQAIVPRKRSSKVAEGALIVGAVDYGPPASGGSMLFGPLKATGPELDGIVERLRRGGEDKAIALRGAQATEARFRELAPGRRILHLATHGFVRHDLSSALEKRSERDDRLVAPELRRFLSGMDPMVLAGVALADANRAAAVSGTDGLLTALEVSTLSLDGVELVTLSACDTARGTVRAGEGVMGLVRGFREAGAGSVVASLWPVADEATKRLMIRFYAELDEGRSVPEALRAAALALRDVDGRETVKVLDPKASKAAGRLVARELRLFALPRQWAAFIAVGPVRRRGGDGAPRLQVGGRATPSPSAVVESSLSAPERAAADAARALFRAALQKSLAGDRRGASEGYREAIRRAPRGAYPNASVNLGFLRLELGEPEGALEDFETALRYFPDYPEAWLGRARAVAVLDRGGEELALRCVERSLELDPDLVGALCFRAERLASRRPADALRDANRAATLAPTRSVVHIARARALCGSRRPKEGLEAAARAIEIDPGSWRAWMAKGTARRDLGDLPGAAADFRRALEGAGTGEISEGTRREVEAFIRVNGGR